MKPLALSMALAAAAFAQSPRVWGPFLPNSPSARCIVFSDAASLAQEMTNYGILARKPNVNWAAKNAALAIIASLTIQSPAVRMPPVAWVIELDRDQGKTCDAAPPLRSGVRSASSITVASATSADERAPKRASPDIGTQVTETIAGYWADTYGPEFAPDTYLDDIDLDSDDLAEISVRLEKRFKIKLTGRLEGLRKISDLIGRVERAIARP